MRPALVLFAWLAAATVFVGSGAAAQLKPPAPQIILLSLTAILLGYGILVKSVQTRALSLDPRIPVAFHLTRFVGAYFLYLSDRGELPSTFAVPAGVGDLAVACLATVLLLTTSPKTGRWLYLAWNVFGLVDILFVVSSATAHGLEDPTSMAALLRLPLGLLPTFVVPIIISTHVLLFVVLSKSDDVNP